MPGISPHPTDAPEHPEAYRVLSAGADGDPRDMTLAYLRSEARSALAAYRDRHEQLATADALTRRADELEEFFLDSIGGLPDRTPLSATVTGSAEKARYTLETVLFESRPAFPVTANLYLPTAEFEPPYPGVAIPCGHSSTGKATTAYQKAAALIAANGMAALVFDPVGQGERPQSEATRSLDSATDPHNRLNTGEILLGRNVARTHLWDGMRALDYLASRPEVDGERLGVAGNSGGGNQAAYLAAVEDRLEAAATIGYVKSYERRTFDGKVASCSESNVHRQAAVGCFDQEYLLMAAPTPTLVGVAHHDQHFHSEGTWDVFRKAKRMYGVLGVPERLGIVESETDHGFYRPLREATTQWLLRWLRGVETTVTEPDDLSVPTGTEGQVTPTGCVLDLDGTRTAYDGLGERQSQLQADRTSRWEHSKAEGLERVREVAQIRPLGELSVPDSTLEWTDRKDGCRIESYRLEPEPGISLPVLRFVPEGDNEGSPLLWLDEEGKHTAAKSDEVGSGRENGRPVVAVDVRGTGETAQDRYGNYDGRFGTDWREMYGASMLGLSPVGMRAEDVLRTALWTRAEFDSEHLDLRARGEMTIPALHAAALEQAVFDHVTLTDRPAPWPSVVTDPEPFPIGSLVYGALAAYDRTDLLETLEASSTTVRVETD